MYFRVEFSNSMIFLEIGSPFLRIILQRFCSGLRYSYSGNSWKNFIKYQDILSSEIITFVHMTVCLIN